LSTSIDQIGLQHPISVARASDCGDELRFVLVAGLHRLEACRNLGWSEIPAIQVELNGPQQELWEIDENLCRVELTELEKSEHLLKRKQIYEGLHPQTQQHVAGARGANASMKRGDATANFATASFADDTSNKTGISSRTIRQLTRRAREITEEVRNRIRANLQICDNGTELDGLASLPPDDQERAVDLVEDGTCKSIKAAKRLLRPTTNAQLPSREDQAPTTAYVEPSTEQYRELIKLLVSAALRAKPIPQAQKIADLLRSCGCGDFADRVSRGIDFESKIVPE
jgi:ParB family chromosome partitioning protein